jgi:hypothetical protein
MNRNHNNTVGLLTPSKAKQPVAVAIAQHDQSMISQEASCSSSLLDADVADDGRFVSGDAVCLSMD